MQYSDEERIGKDDRVLVIVTNQYMWMQLEWYHSKYPEGKWDALIISFQGKTANIDLMKIMYDKCLKSNFFSNIYIYEKTIWSESLSQKIIKAFLWLLHTRKREIYDEIWIKDILGNQDYKKVIVQSNHARLSTAAINTFRDKILICLEDGMCDYCPIFRPYLLRHPEQIFWYICAQFNILGFPMYGYQFKLKYDNRMIKYCSLPDRMQYREYKEIRQLFDDNLASSISENKNVKDISSPKGKYDIIVFSSSFNDADHAEQVYAALYKYLKKNCNGEKVLIKPHPRETYQFDWNEPNIEIGYLDMAGEEVMDMFPEAKLLFAGTSNILIKASRTKRNFKIIIFSCIKSKRFRKHIALDSQFIGVNEDQFIYL